MTERGTREMRRKRVSAQSSLEKEAADVLSACVASEGGRGRAMCFALVTSSGVLLAKRVHRTPAIVRV